MFYIEIYDGFVFWNFDAWPKTIVGTEWVWVHRVFLKSAAPQISCNQRHTNNCNSQNCHATSLSSFTQLTVCVSCCSTAIQVVTKNLVRCQGARAHSLESRVSIRLIVLPRQVLCLMKDFSCGTMEITLLTQDREGLGSNLGSQRFISLDVFVLD